MKITQALLQPLVMGSISFAEVLRKLGLKPAGGSHARLRRLVAEFALSTQHFTGQGSNRGSDHKGGPKRLMTEEVLTLGRTGRKEKTYDLRKALLQSGVEEKCEVCGQPPGWQGKPLRLQIDHRNGNSLDNRPGNPRFLCPNCHTQTENFGARNMGWRARHGVLSTGVKR
jgi:hypothetical protein